MKWMHTILVVILLGAFCLRCDRKSDLNSGQTSPKNSVHTLPASIPWNMSVLNTPPAFRWLDQESQIWSVIYQAEPYQDQITEVFAYYATPATLNRSAAAKGKYPAVVLVHGGGGHAFREWVELWAKRGYAAIAMDLAGYGQDLKRLEKGGPDQVDSIKFGQIDSPLSDQWPYHAVANVILANSLVGSFQEVDADRIAITGISWGGYLTCIVAGIDSRFKAAVPVYGCGFLHENSAWLSEFDKMLPIQRDKWVRLFDPSIYIGFATMPIFFINGSNDFAYPLDSYAKTYQLVQSKVNFRITVDMPHGHQQGWSPKEIGLFIDQYLNNGIPLPRIQKPILKKDKVSAKIITRTKLISAQLHYTTDSGPINKRDWVTTSAVLINNGQVESDALSKQANIWFITVTDERDATVSSELVFGTD